MRHQQKRKRIVLVDQIDFKLIKFSVNAFFHFHVFIDECLPKLKDKAFSLLLEDQLNMLHDLCRLHFLGN